MIRGFTAALSVFRHVQLEFEALGKPLSCSKLRHVATPIETESRIVGMYLQHNPYRPGQKPKREARKPAQGQSSAAGAQRRTSDWMPSEGQQGFRYHKGNENRKLNFCFLGTRNKNRKINF